MFNRIKTYFSKPYSDSAPSINLATTDNQQELSHTGKSKTWVYVWNMTSGNVGHAAIQIGGDSPKIKDEQPGEYISIHPKNIPALGPTIILPLPAELATTLSADMESEAASKHGNNFDTLDSTSTPSKFDRLSTSLPPDKTFKIEGLDTEAMQRHVYAIRNNVKSGESAYQLLPNVNTVGFVKGFLQDSAAFISQDPIDVEMHRRHKREPMKQSCVNNCTTLVSDILNTGGMPITQSKTPWGLTPNGLADQLHKDEIKSFRI